MNLPYEIPVTDGTDQASKSGSLAMAACDPAVRIVGRKGQVHAGTITQGWHRESDPHRAARHIQLFEKLCRNSKLPAAVETGGFCRGAERQETQDILGFVDDPEH